MTGPERHLRRLMAVYAVLYLAFGLVLLIYPEGIFRAINRVTEWIGFGNLLDVPTYPFWSVITVSLLFLLALMCYLAYRDINNRLLVELMIFAKLVSSLCQFGYFALSADHPFGFVVGAVVDGFLGTLALVYLLRAGTKVSEGEGSEGPARPG